MTSLNDITLRKPKFDFMETEYGKISYLEWCQRESERIGKHTRVVQNIRNCWIENTIKSVDKG